MAVRFVEFVGATGAELGAIQDGKLTVEKLVERLATDVTDFGRSSVIYYSANILSVNRFADFPYEKPR